MAQRSSVEQLPEAVRHALERKLAENGFGNYTELTAWLNQQGFEISRSAVHRYGQKVERRFASIKASTEAARLLAEAAADDNNNLSAALTSMLQDEMLQALLEINEHQDDENKSSPAERLVMFATVGKNIAPLISANTNLKKFQATQRENLAKKFAELEAESQKQNSSLDMATLQRIRQEVYGVI